MVRAENGTLAGVLEGKKQYQIPLYQRVYSWGNKQLRQLWTDVVELGRALGDDPKASHFIGSLVLASSPDFGAIGVNKFLVVDGQQRLTSLTDRIVVPGSSGMNGGRCLHIAWSVAQEAVDPSLPYFALVFDVSLQPAFFKGRLGGSR
ncbi:hypothetical protein ART_3566 [Arthrobacter sp. PAMC 25486]|uniref:DUF262 domain-containing protein n=1 Tax=Arthrobacter sp. PAMC 25486 TaxID=1494608 RepID=UPI00053621CD|nr:DUF262 domain-containing protein [Arthrobacter sp. PAMC 25486]AIY03165.1 hypothetical protein ART_3566 [Arthrobacter sp. PAMC 25486]